MESTGTAALILNTWYDVEAIGQFQAPAVLLPGKNLGSQ